MKKLIFVLTTLLIGSAVWAQGSKLSDLPSLSAPSNADLFYVVDGGKSKKLAFSGLQPTVFDQTFFSKVTSPATDQDDYLYFWDDNVGDARMIKFNSILDFSASGIYVNELTSIGDDDYTIIWDETANEAKRVNWYNFWRDITDVDLLFDDSESSDNIIIADSIYADWTGSSGGNLVISNSFGAASSFDCDQSTILGISAGLSLTSGDRNTMVGYYAGSGLTSGENNVFIGNEAGAVFSTGSNNICIGYQADPPSNDSYRIIIGSDGTNDFIDGDASEETLHLDVEELTSQTSDDNTGFHLTKTVYKTIGYPGHSSTDYTWTANGNTSQQVITLTDIVPAYAKVLDVVMITTTNCRYGGNTDDTFVAEGGTSSSGSQLWSDADLDDVGDIGEVGTGSAYEIATSSSSASLYISGTPGLDWDGMISGDWVVAVTYTDYQILIDDSGL